MYSSEHFGRLFWVDDELEFMTCPQFTDGTGDFDREEYDKESYYDGNNFTREAN